jgi:hypothetical protein
VTKAALLLLLLLSSCSFATKWKDMTGQERGDGIAKQDNDACEQETGANPDISHLSNDEAQAEWRKVRACMKAKGWILVRADNDEPITFGND